LTTGNSNRTYLNKNLEIDFRAVGHINSFNNTLVVIDSDFANKLLGLSLARSYQYNYQVFDELQTGVKAGIPDTNGYVSDFNRYHVKTINYVQENDGNLL
jgi:hypothetical protein